jgi:predicted RNA polymerase sigma factor
MMATGIWPRGRGGKRV